MDGFNNFDICVGLVLVKGKLEASGLMTRKNKKGIDGKAHQKLNAFIKYMCSS